jgi:hypothetical protein
LAEEVRWEQHPEGLLFYLRGDVRALVAFRTTTQHKVTLWSGTVMTPPDVGDLNRAGFRKRLSKTAAEAFGLDEVATRGVEHDLGGVAVALEKQLDDEDGAKTGETLADLLKGLGGPSVAQLLVKYGSEGELFHDPDQEAYATVEVEGHRETYALRSKAYRNWLRHRYFTGEQEAGEYDPAAPRAQTLADAINQLEAKAQFEGAERNVFVRLAEHGGNVYLDLADEAWRCVEIAPDGWRVIAGDAAPVKFLRPKGLAPLPAPVAGGSVEDLRPLTNLPDGDSWRLAVAWMLAALRPKGPYPVLVLQGEQGSSKSTTERLLRAIVDPNTAPLRSTPRSEHDLYIAGTSSHVIAYDNISRLPDWLSDALCRVATGGGFSTRQLYSDREQELFDAMRPVALNGIGDVATRPDLLDRAIVVALPTIPRGQRRPERELWAQFHAGHPGVLGALLDAVSAGLKNLPITTLEALPRMADFAVWMAACEEGLGWEPGTFAEAYEANRSDANQRALESSPLALAVWRLMREREEWIGTSTQLLQELKSAATKEQREDSGFPRAANSLSAEMNRIAPALREGVGIEYADQAREGREGRRVKRLTWITDPEKDRQHRQNRQHAEKDLQNKGFGSAFTADADDTPLSADERPSAPSSANGHKETPGNGRVFPAADDADGPDDDLRRPYKHGDSSPNGSRLAAAPPFEATRGLLARPPAWLRDQIEHARGQGFPNGQLKALAFAVSAHLYKEHDRSGEVLPVIEAMLTHPLDCQCEECV